MKKIYSTLKFSFVLTTLILVSCGSDDDNTTEEPTNQSFIKYTQDNGQDIYLEIVGVSSTTNWDNSTRFSVRGMSVNYPTGNNYLLYHKINFNIPRNFVGTLTDTNHQVMYIHPLFDYVNGGIIGYPNWVYAVQQNYNTYCTYVITENNNSAVKGTFTAYLRSAYNTVDDPPNYMTVTNGAFEIYRDDVTYEVY